jgi:hypothetical protein
MDRDVIKAVYTTDGDRQLSLEPIKVEILEVHIRRDVQWLTAQRLAHHPPPTEIAITIGRIYRSKKATISCAKRSGAWAGWARWPRTLTCCPHERTAPAHNHASTTSLDRNHIQHTTTLPRTGNPHDGPAYHICTTSIGTTSLAQRAFSKYNRLSKLKPGCSPRCPSRPTCCASAAALIDRDEVWPKTGCQNGDDLVREAVGCKRLLGAHLALVYKYKHL